VLITSVVLCLASNKEVTSSTQSNIARRIRAEIVVNNGWTSVIKFRRCAIQQAGSQQQLVAASALRAKTTTLGQGTRP